MREHLRELRRIVFPDTPIAPPLAAALWPTSQVWQAGAVADLITDDAAVTGATPALNRDD
jgi:hypothetical protein